METVARVHAAQTTVTAEMLKTVQENLLKRCRLCLQVDGRHFSIYWIKCRRIPF